MSKETIFKKISFLKLILLFLMIISLCTSIFAIYELLKLESIENLIRYIVIGILGLIDILILIKMLLIFKKRAKNRHSKRIGFILFLIFYSIFCGVIGGVIFYLFGTLKNMNTGYVTYSSSLVMMNDSSVNNIKDVTNLKIGIWNNEKSPDGYIIPQEIIKEYKLNDENEIIDYEDYSSMLTDLYAEEIDAMILPSNYVDMFVNIAGYENIAKDTKVITTKSKEMKKADVSEVETASSGKDITEPFTILLMGIDSTAEVLEKNAIANGDTLILMTFNPKTLNATMLSIPRDSYVPIACWSNKAENKITHAAGYGTDCMMNTISEYFGVKIDYYAKINFKGLVKLVDAVGGVEIDVKQRLCTDDSNRGETVCIEPGYQTLHGEQALVYARNRYDLVDGDFGRNKHQQEIVMAIANKFKNITDITKFKNILDTVSNSLDTNLTTKQMLSFYNVGKDIIKKSLSSKEADLINIQQLHLAGNDQYIYDERMRMVLYNYVPNKNSRNDIVRAMNENLGLAEAEKITKFDFSINDPYEKSVIGKGPYKTSSLYRLLPDFTGDDMATAKATAARLGIGVIFEGNSGYVIAQNYPPSKRIDLMNGSLKLTLSGKKEENDNNDKEEDKEENDNSSETGGESSGGSESGGESNGGSETGGSDGDNSESGGSDNSDSSGDKDNTTEKPKQPDE